MRLKDLLSKYRKYLIVAAIILSSIAISIRSKDGGVSLILGEYPILIFLLVVISSFLVVIYIHFNQRKLTDLSNQIKILSKKNSQDISSLLDELTDRQKEIYDLIMEGKTNKEIATKLFIEKSTLKTHINQIYKKLNIKSRRELKSKSKNDKGISL